MNEFTAKKLGEVLAFTRIGLEMYERAKGALINAWGEAEVDRFWEELEVLSSELESSANEVTNQKAEATTEKLRGMMEAYVGAEWDNPAELLEWSGFYFGSAIIHWSLVAGAAKATEDDSVGALAVKALEVNRRYFQLSEEKITEIAKAKAIQ